MLTDSLQVLATAQRNQRLASWRAQPGRALLHATLLLAIAVALTAAGWRALSMAPKVNEITIGQAVTVLLAITLLTAAMVDRARRALIDAHAASWLASAPVSQVSIARHHRRIVGKRWCLAAPALLLLLTALLWRAGVSAPLIVVACVVMSIALLLGAALGWRLGSSARSAATRRRAARVANAVPGAGFAALARWPTARLRERSSGQHLAPLVAPVLLLMPIGVSGGVALAIIALWVVLLIAVEMWLALRDTVPRAYAFLRATPLSAARFAWLMMQRALVVWLWISALLVGAAAVIGMPMAGALVGAVLLLALGATGATALLLPHLHRALREATS